MNRNNGKKIIRILTVLTSILFFILPVHADTGPKPSLRIQCSGFPENSYVTVLSALREYGPNREMKTWDYESQSKDYFDMRGIEKEVFIAISEEAERLADAGESLYFWGVVSKCEDEYLFGYWPPEEFKILIYMQDTDEFILSDEVYTRKVFNTAYSCTYENNAMQIRDISTANLSLAGVLLRLLITVAVEYVIGLLFMKYTAKSRMTVILANIITQMLLNVCITLTALKFGSGTPVYAGAILIFEAFIILTEWLIYKTWIRKDQLAHPLLYSAAANCASYAFGLYVSAAFPVLPM